MAFKKTTRSLDFADLVQAGSLQCGQRNEDPIKDERITLGLGDGSPLRV